jgi:hypothetical protein
VRSQRLSKRKVSPRYKLASSEITREIARHKNIQAKRDFSKLRMSPEKASRLAWDPKLKVPPPVFNCSSRLAAHPGTWSQSMDSNLSDVGLAWKSGRPLSPEAGPAPETATVPPEPSEGTPKKKGGKGTSHSGGGSPAKGGALGAAGKPPLPPSPAMARLARPYQTAIAAQAPLPFARTKKAQRQLRKKLRGKLGTGALAAEAGRALARVCMGQRLQDVTKHMPLPPDQQQQVAEVLQHEAAELDRERKQAFVRAHLERPFRDGDSVEVWRNPDEMDAKEIWGRARILRCRLDNKFNVEYQMTSLAKMGEYDPGSFDPDSAKLERGTAVLRAHMRYAPEEEPTQEEREDRFDLQQDTCGRMSDGLPAHE